MPFTAIRDVLAPVAEICLNCPTPTLIGAYLMSARELCFRARLRELEQIASTVLNERLVLLTETTDEEPIGVYAVAIAHTINDYEPMAEGNSGDWHRAASNGRPEEYQYVAPNYLALMDLPNAAFPLIITKVMQPKLTATQVDTGLVARWGDCIEAGALYRLLRIKGQKWSDPVMAVQHYWPKFDADVRAAGIQHGRRDNPGSSQTDAPGGASGFSRSRIQAI